MKPDQAEALRDLLQTQRIASLGTLHRGEPYVSMVPFALLSPEAVFVIHVSGLSSHTKDMLASPEVSLLVVAPPSPDAPAQALARATIQGQAMQFKKAESSHALAKTAYLARFPQSSMMFDLPDFSLFGIRPRSVRYIGGFAQAVSIRPEVLVKLLE